MKQNLFEIKNNKPSPLTKNKNKNKNIFNDNFSNC